MEPYGALMGALWSLKGLTRPLRASYKALGHDPGLLALSLGPGPWAQGQWNEAEPSKFGHSPAPC